MSYYEASLKDVYKDEIEVAAKFGEVFIDFGTQKDMALTPKKARKLAKHLNRAADHVEGLR